MSDHINGFTVVLNRALHETDAAGVREAIRHLRHVISVEPIVDDPASWTAAMQERARLRKAIFELLELTETVGDPK